MSAFSWIIEKLKEHDYIKSATVLNENFLEIARKKGPTLTVTTSPLSKFYVTDIKSILQKNNADFILHTFKDPYVDGGVYGYLDSNEKIIGDFSDLFKVIRQDVNWPYVSPEAYFIDRGLRQHKKVQSFSKLDNKRYQITRKGLETVTILVLNDYDIGIESIRHAIDVYKSFDAVLKSNPNGRISDEAYAFAASGGFKILRWGELLGQLNRAWD